MKMQLDCLGEKPGRWQYMTSRDDAVLTGLFLSAVLTLWKYMVVPKALQNIETDFSWLNVETMCYGISNGFYPYYYLVM